MPEHPNHTATRAKHVYLTDDGRAAVQAWADREEVTFSAAIETLARLGLQQDPRDAWGPTLAAKVVGAVRADLGRYRALLAATALDAGITLRVASAATRTLRPKEYADIKRLARLEAVAALRRRDALAELDLPDASPEETSTESEDRASEVIAP
jgi:hypothetical protein